MAYKLRQSTASQEVPIGPFVDSTDGVTAEVSLVVAAANTFWHVTAATTMVNVGLATLTHITSGYYLWVADATDTATAGPAVLHVYVTGALPCKLVCDILPANIWDSLFSTDKLDVNVSQIAGTGVEGDGSATPWNPV